MAKKKRHLYVLNDDPREVFIHMLDSCFKHNWDQNVSFEAWKVYCGCNDDRTERWLVAFHAVLQSPPPDFEMLLYYKGDLRFVVDDELPTERDYTLAEKLTWAKATYLKFAGYFFSTHPHLIPGDYLSV